MSILKKTLIASAALALPGLVSANAVREDDERSITVGTAVR